MTHLFKILIFLLIPSISFGAEFAIPSTRTIDWGNSTFGAGSKTDFAARTTACDDATYGTSLSPAECNGDGNCAPEIEAMFGSCGTNTVIVLEAGTFPITSTIDIEESNITLRGQGIGVTLLVGGAGFSGDTFFDINNNVPSSSYEWTSNKTLTSTGLLKDSTQINTSAAHGWQTGDYVLIDQDNDEAAGWTDDGDGGACNWCSRLSGERVTGQVVQVTVVDSDTANIQPPLYYDYLTAQSAEASIFNDIIEGLSIESMTVDNRASDAKYTLSIFFLFDSLFYDLDLRGTPATGGGAHVYIWGGLWVTFRKNTVREAEGNESNMGYGIFERMGTSAFLMEDNIFDTLQMAIAWEGASSGNVFAYNHTINSAWYDATANRLMVLGHGAGGHMNLVEGNVIEGRFRGDYYWGTSQAFTIFRNHIEMQAGKTTQTFLIDLEWGERRTNVVGNVLGTSGNENAYESENDDEAVWKKWVYRLGYTGAYDFTAAGNDSQVKTTLLRHANWEYVNNDYTLCSETAREEINLCQSATNTNYPTDTLPQSLYLTSEPDWWCTESRWSNQSLWAAFNPVTPTIKDIPAKIRYDSGTCTAVTLVGPRGAFTFPGNPFGGFGGF